MLNQSELKECRYFLVRYVPDVVKQEFINIGLFLYCPAERFLDCVFTDDWRRVSRFHAHADTEFLRDLQSHFEQRIREHETDLEGFVRELHESYSNLIQLSPLRTCLASDLGAQLQQLFARHVGVAAAAPRKQDTRMRIKQRLSQSLRAAGVLGHPLFEKDIPAAQWTGPGDPFLFDFGYKPPARPGKRNGSSKLIHTLSLEKDATLVEALKWTFDRVLEKAPCYLTVGHEADPDLANPAVRFSQDVLQHRQIRLVPVSGFDAYAQSVRVELM